MNLEHIRQTLNQWQIPFTITSNCIRYNVSELNNEQASVEISGICSEKLKSIVDRYYKYAMSFNNSKS
jgi:hypothetical protein